MSRTLYLPAPGQEVVAATVQSVLPPVGEYVTERAGEFFLLLDPALNNGRGWRAYDCLQQAATSPWMEPLRQYGVRSLTYAGFTGVTFPPGASGGDVWAAALPFMAPSRLVICMTTADVQGFLSDGWAAYHTWGDPDQQLALVPWWPDAAAPFGQPATFTLALTHEVAEWLTDPDGRGFPEDGDFTGEVGDRCNWQPYAVGPYLVSKVWDDARGVCGPV